MPSICLYSYTLTYICCVFIRWCTPPHTTSEEVRNTSSHVSRGADARTPGTCPRWRHPSHSSNNSNSHNFYLSTRISQTDCWDRPCIGSFALLPLENPLVLLVAARGGKPRYLRFPDNSCNIKQSSWLHLGLRSLNINIFANYPCTTGNRCYAIEQNYWFQKGQNPHLPPETVSLCNEYGDLFHWAYRMDHAAFQKLYKILKNGIMEYLA